MAKKTYELGLRAFKTASENDTVGRMGCAFIRTAAPSIHMVSVKCLYVHLSCNTAHYDALQHTTPFRDGAGCACTCLCPVTRHIAVHYSTLHSYVECDSLFVPLCVFILQHSTLRRTTTHHSIQGWSGMCLQQSLSFSTAHCDALQRTTAFRCGG